MKSQWECIRQNVGTWYGSFTQFSADGKQVKDTPSVLTLEETEPDEKMQLTLKRTPPGESTHTVRRTFSAPGPAPYVYFFESGAFSQGASQWVAFKQFGAKMSIKVGDRRVRFVVMYESTAEGTSRLDYVTLIRETREEDAQFEQPALMVRSLFGQWKGQVEVLNAAMNPLSKGNSGWQFKNSTLTSRERFDEGEQSVSLSGEEANLEADEPVILQGALPYQLMPLPNGAYCLAPQTICKGEAFRVEVGWLQGEGERTSDEDVSRTRLIRYYDAQGVWTHTALIEDRRQDSSSEAA